jgi:hypothetical protein
VQRWAKPHDHYHASDAMALLHIQEKILTFSSLEGARVSLKELWFTRRLLPNQVTRDKKPW